MNADSLELLRKTINAGRIHESCKIDGYLNEAFWSNLPPAKDFIQYSPQNKSYPSFNTVIRFGYDDEALYIGAEMFDPEPGKLYTELGLRDKLEELAVDYVSIDILPYNDGLNMYEFKVSPSGLQHDCKYSAVGQDITWDAVWYSATRIGDSAWYAEIKIPYSALRFPKSSIQVWGINMWRCIRRNNEWSTWSYVDNSVTDIFKFYGELKGIENIDPPLRLSATPYLATYIDKNAGSSKWSKSLKGGVDLRWGINESYTLDMMLIPDFGQVQLDDEILNLSPFEIRYDEKRQFFTEGTEMFNKGGILYSRRIGGLPRNYKLASQSLTENESIVSNPEESRIINATKISGRSAKGLGAGFFNTMTSSVYAEIRNDSSGATREFLTQPFTNYNVLVLDQNLKNNSYLSLINTNLYSPEDNYYANVTGFEAKIHNKTRTFETYASLNVSNTEKDSTQRNSGHQLNFYIYKPRGKFQYQVSHEDADSHYNPNDMGYLEVNNYSRNTASFWYNFYDPAYFFNSQIFKGWIFYNTLYDNPQRISSGFGIASKTTYKNFYYSFLSLSATPWGSNDYNESRSDGWFYHLPPSLNTTFQLITDPRKAFNITLNENIIYSSQISRIINSFSISPRYKFSDRFSMNILFGANKSKNDFGWVHTTINTGSDPEIFFGKRDILAINTVLSGQFIFNTKLITSLRLRHYWSKAHYTNFCQLMKNGSLLQSDYSGVHDINFNTFTGDLQLIWYFAPGSELSIVWRDGITTNEVQITEKYFDNLQNIFDQPLNRSISLRILYYLDYNTIKNKTLKNPAV